MNVILVTRDGKRRSIKEKLARHLVKAGKGYIEGEQDFIAPEPAKVKPISPVDLFEAQAVAAADGGPSESDESADEDQDGPLVSDSVKEFAESEGVDLTKVQGTGRRGRVIRADVQAYKSRMLAARSAAPGGDQDYQTTDMKAD